jgi:nucleoside-diphosphate-sugar epimerase
MPPRAPTPRSTGSSTVADPPARVLVTGAAGFIGRALVDRFRVLGSEVRGVDLIETDDGDLISADLTESGPWKRHAADCDLVVHTAAVVGMYSSREGYWEANVIAPRLVMDAAIAGGAKRFVHLSSIVVYGFDFEGEVDERTPVRPNGVHYVDTKIASEQVVLEAHAEGEIPCTIVRPGDVYGPGSRPWTTEPLRLLKSKQLILPGGGRGLHSPVFVDDLVEGVVRAATTPEAEGRIFILTGAERPTIGEFFGHYCRMLGIDGPRTAPTRIVREVARGMDLAARVRGRRSEATPAAIDYLNRRGSYSIERAREVLGYEPARDLEAGMRKTEEWLRSEGLI